MRVVVNDANVLIDIIKLQLLPQFFALKHVYYTTDFILEELHPHQRQELQPYIDKRNLRVMTFDTDEMIMIGELQSEKPQLSEQDCSAIICTNKVNGELLTSDNILRKFALSRQMTVRGHLWVLDQLVFKGILSGSQATLKLNELIDNVNPRLGLPLHECDARKKAWRRLT